MTGRLVVFEGVEGAGKSTQLRRLGARLERAGIASRTLREPGGTAIGDRVRAVLLDPSSQLDPRTEAHLFMASRAQLVATEVRPALAAGTLVLLDRFFLSTYAYQIAGRGLPESDVRGANALATGGLVPDLTIVVDLGARDGLARVVSRGPIDRMERAGPEFLARVERAFSEFTTPAWQRTHPEAGRIVAVDGRGSEDAVEARVIDAIAATIPALAALREHAVA
jgi:dTMP kinase